jgi:hypothetical protein
MLEDKRPRISAVQASNFSGVRPQILEVGQASEISRTGGRGRSEMRGKILLCSPRCFVRALVESNVRRRGRALVDKSRLSLNA